MGFNGFDELKQDVIGVGLCTACGTCIGVCPRRCIQFDPEAEEPVLHGECKPCGACYGCCPGKDIPFPELEKMVFSRERHPAEGLLGVASRYLKGSAKDPAVRKAGASGGCATALLIYALEKGIIDGAVVTGMSATLPWRAEPRIATTRAEILQSAQSKYCVVPSNSVLNEADDRGLRKLAIVGLPCHIHGLRKMQMHGRPKRALERVKFLIGIFCGSNFPAKATEDLVTKYAGVPLEQIEKFEYRGGPQSHDTQLTTRDGKTIVVPTEGRARGLTRLRRDRCAVCLDFSAELADISLGDVFLPLGSETRLSGVSAIVVRTGQGEALVHGAEKHGDIETSHLDKSGFSYNTGFELKSHYTPYYLLKRRKSGWPTPDFHRQPKCEPLRSVQNKEAILEQIRNVPEVAAWVAQNPKYREQLAKIDPEIVMVVDELDNKGHVSIDGA